MLDYEIDEHEQMILILDNEVDDPAFEDEGDAFPAMELDVLLFHFFKLDVSHLLQDPRLYEIKSGRKRSILDCHNILKLARSFDPVSYVVFE